MNARAPAWWMRLSFGLALAGLYVAWQPARAWIARTPVTALLEAYKTPTQHLVGTRPGGLHVEDERTGTVVSYRAPLGFKFWGVALLLAFLAYDPLRWIGRYALLHLLLDTLELGTVVGALRHPGWVNGQHLVGLWRDALLLLALLLMVRQRTARPSPSPGPQETEADGPRGGIPQ